MVWSEGGILAADSQDWSERLEIEPRDWRRLVDLVGNSQPVVDAA